MRIPPFLTVLLFACLAPWIRAEEPPAGFHWVFNGKDLAGWKVPAENPWWSVENGVLIGRADAQLKGNVFETEKEYRDVIIETEVRWSGDVDSGIFLRKGSHLQVQLGVSRSLQQDMTCSLYVPKAGYVVRAENVEKLLKIGDWNKVRIEAYADHYKIWLNGGVVVDTDLAGFEEAGPIALQIHGGVPDMKVEFRNFVARELE